MSSSNPYSYQYLTEPIYRAVLRALAHYGAGCYIDINPQHPSTHSITNTLYELGWVGVNVEVVPDYWAYLNKVRPTDINLKQALDGEQSELSLASLVAQYGNGALQLLRINRLGKNHANLQQLNWQSADQRPWIVLLENDQQYLSFHPDQQGLLQDHLLAQHYQVILQDTHRTVLVANEHSLLQTQVAQIAQAHLPLPRPSIWKRLSNKPGHRGQTAMSRWQIIKNLFIKLKTVIADGRLVPVLQQRVKKWIKPLLGRLMHISWLRKIAYLLMDRVSIVHHLAALMKEAPPASTPPLVSSDHASAVAKPMPSNNGSTHKAYSSPSEEMLLKLQQSIQLLKD